MKIKQGDTFPNPTADLNADVTGAAVSFRMMHLNGNFFLEDIAVVDTPATGIVHYDWQAGDTDIVGAYRCEFVVVFVGGDVQSFPQGSYLEIVIRPEVPAA